MAYLVFAGDWHNDTFWAKQVIYNMSKFGIKRIYHVGDFCLWPGLHGQRFIHKVHRWLEMFDMEIWVTPGNHEDWDRLEEIWARNPYGPAPTSKKYPRIKWLPRGYRWVDQEISLVSFGGAPSVNRSDLTEGKDWWPQEAITEEHVAQVSAAGYADIMITHDSPNPGTKKIQQIITGPSKWKTLDLIYADYGRYLLTQAFEAVKPKLLVHGHFHVLDILRNTEQGWGDVISLAHEHHPQGGNVAIINAVEFKYGETYEIEVPKVIPHWGPNNGE